MDDLYIVSHYFWFIQVTWFKKKASSLDVLTIDHETFSADRRYSIAYKGSLLHQVRDQQEIGNSENFPLSNWRLKIKPARKEDNGTYLCQVSTHPPMSIITYLRIIGKKASKFNDQSGLSFALYCTPCLANECVKIITVRLWSGGSKTKLNLANLVTLKSPCSIKELHRVFVHGTRTDRRTTCMIILTTFLAGAWCVCV